MPRGQRKKGQYAFKVWFPDGGSVSIGSTKDLSAAEWITAVREGMALIERGVKAVADGTLRSTQSSRRHRGSAAQK